MKNNRHFNIRLIFIDRNILLIIEILFNYHKGKNIILFN